MSPGARKSGGFTCCQDPGLRNDRSELDQRLDFLMVRADSIGGPDGNARGQFRTVVVGDQRRDRTPSGLWPADHAGLYGSMRIARRGKDRD
jgi:hypothetical protein